MRTAGILIVFLLLLNGVLFSEVLSLQNMNFLRMSDGAECGYGQDDPPPIDSLCLVYAGIDYGAGFNSPQAYPNAKHITNVRVGSYYFPVILWETGDSWSKQSLFSYWDDMFKFWSYPDSFTTNAGVDTGRPMVSVDSHGNLHFCWHQTGSPDGYETFYTRAILDTSAGVVQYTIERPAQFISQTDGTEARFPSMGIYDDTLIMVVFDLGRPVNATGYNYSTDGGSTWAGQGIAYDPGSALPGSWIQPCTAVDPNTGDTWVALCFDESGDGSMDLNILHWEASSDIWTIETAHNATSMHPYATPSIVCDNNGIPHVIFQENLTTTGGSGGLSGWDGCGPAGTLYYTHRQGGSWSAPIKIMFPRYPVCNYASGYPSAGIAADNTVYFSVTQPDSATPDTARYLPFNAYYGEISPYVGAIAYGGKVSNIPWADTMNAIYPHTTYNVPLEGPGITWCQMISAAPPSDAYYNHSDSLLGIAEEERIPTSVAILYQNAPNPFTEKTTIKFCTEQRQSAKLAIYDISGRMVRSWVLPAAHSLPSTGIVWDGKDVGGNDVPGGVYLYTLRTGGFSETRKLLVIR